jgi:NitT/TauT family transport system permease protein
MPLALMMFGFGVGLEASVVAYACVWPILIVTITAVRAIEGRLLEVAAVLELPLWKEADDQNSAACGLRADQHRPARFCCISLVVAVTVEIVLNPRGLGYNLILAEQSLQIGLMWAQLVWLCLLGYVLNLVLSHVGRGPAAIWRPL